MSLQSALVIQSLMQCNDFETPLSQESRKNRCDRSISHKSDVSPHIQWLTLLGKFVASLRYSHIEEGIAGLAARRKD